MAMRASETFFTAANTVDGRRRAFYKDAPVPADVAKAVRGLVYDDGAKGAPTHDGTPPDIHTCAVCGKVAKSAAGLAAHGRSHDDDDA